MAIVPSPVASGPITRPIANMDNKEKTAAATLSANTQLGERGPGRRVNKMEDHPSDTRVGRARDKPLRAAEGPFELDRPVARTASGKIQGGVMSHRG